MKNTDEIYEGGCLCGAIRYRATATAYHIAHCHCPTCRKASGCAFISWLSFPIAEFSFTRGKPTYFASSEKVQRGFCDQCGTALTYQIQGTHEIDVTICSLDNPESVTPEFHIWVQYQLSWLKLADTLPRYKQHRTPRVD